MTRILLLLLLLASRSASAVCTATPYMSDPVTIVGTQGRPIPNASVSVTTQAGLPVVVYTDPTGCTPYTVVPPHGICQFFTDTAGEFIVSVQGQGVTRPFRTTAGVGVGASSKRMIFDVSADSMTLPLTLTRPTLNCQAAPCQLTYNDSVDATSYFDFIMPSTLLTFSTLRLSWQNLGDDGAVAWTVDWCTYAIGDVSCFPDGTNSVTVQAPGATVDRRADLVFTPGVNYTAPTWSVLDHVVLVVIRSGTSPLDTNTSDVGLEHVQLEMLR